MKSSPAFGTVTTSGKSYLLLHVHRCFAFRSTFYHRRFRQFSTRLKHHHRWLLVAHARYMDAGSAGVFDFKRRIFLTRGRPCVIFTTWIFHKPTVPVFRQNRKLAGKEIIFKSQRAKEKTSGFHTRNINIARNEWNITLFFLERSKKLTDLIFIILHYLKIVQNNTEIAREKNLLLKYKLNFVTSIHVTFTEDRKL